MTRIASSRVEPLRAALADCEKYLRRLARFIAHVAIPEHPDGFTLDPFRFVFLGRCPRNIYIVSEKVHERRFAGLPSEDDVLDWLRPRFGTLSRPGSKVGGWVDGSFFYLDVSFPVRGRSLAKLIGLANVQLSICHAATRKVITL